MKKVKRQITIAEFDERLCAIARGLDPDKVKDASIIYQRPLKKTWNNRHKGKQI